MLHEALKQIKRRQTLQKILFQHITFYKGRMFEESNNATACALGSEKYIKRRKDSFL